MLWEKKTRVLEFLYSVYFYTISSPCMRLQVHKLSSALDYLSATFHHSVVKIDLVFIGGLDLMNISRISNLLGQGGLKTVFIGPILSDRVILSL